MKLTPVIPEEHRGFSHMLQFDGTAEVRAIVEVHRHHIQRAQEQGEAQKVRSVETKISELSDNLPPTINLFLGSSDFPDLVDKLAAYCRSGLTDSLAPPRTLAEQRLRRRSTAKAIEAMGLLNRELEHSSEAKVMDIGKLDAKVKALP